MMTRLLSGMALALCLGSIVPAHAAIIDFGGEVFTTNASTSTLSLIAVPPPGNQPLNQPCIICGTTQPQQDATFGYNNYKQGGNITTFAASSTSQLGGVQLDNNVLGIGYTGTFLRAFLISQLDLNGVLNVGIDVNTAQGQGAEVLERFVVVDAVNRTILADYNPAGGGTALPTLNNGTGFPDYILSGFNIDRNDIQNDTQLLFLARWSNTSDGAESFFIVPEINAVPGPMAGAGLPGLMFGCLAMLGLVRLRRRVS